MQSLSTARQMHGNQIRIVAFVVMLVGVLGIGAALVAISQSGDARPNANVASLAAPNAYAHYRFLEMNMLPEASAARPMTYEQYRFLEMNVLPKAAPSPAVLFERWHFLEINELPDNNAPLIAPFVDRRSERY